MMKSVCSFLGITAALAMVACGGGDSGSDKAPSTAQEAVDQTLAKKDDPPPKADGAVSCSLLEEIVPTLFEVDLGAVTFHPSAPSGHDVCRAVWPLTDSQPTSPKHYENEVSVTLMGTVYDSPEAAVAGLESDAASLARGVTVKVGGKERTVKRDGGEWVEGVGNKALLRKKSVQVATKSRRFTAAVSVTEDLAKNQELAMELARRLIDAM